MDQKTDQLIKTQAYINGAWVGSPVTEVLDKASGEVIAKVADCGRVETREAIAAAKAAMPAWAKRTAKERSFLLRKWFDLIVAHQHELALILSREQGKPKAEAIQEIQYGAGFVEFFAEEAKRVYGEIIPSHKADGRILVLKQPIGVVAAITPWNFPNAMITRKCGPALAAGCPIVIKPRQRRRCRRPCPRNSQRAASSSSDRPSFMPSCRRSAWSTTTSSNATGMRPAANSVPNRGPRNADERQAEVCVHAHTEAPGRAPRLAAHAVGAAARFARSLPS